MSVWPLAIVGAGPAGIAAAAEAARLGVQPLLLDASGHPGGTIRIAHEVRNIPFLGDAVGGETVVAHLAAFLSHWKVPVEHARIVRLFEASDDFALETEEGARFVASRVVLALGTRALYPVIEGLSPGGRRFVGSAPDASANGIPRRAVVIGGSDVALDQARWLQTRGARVEVLARGEVRAPAWLADAAERDGVVVRRHARVLRAGAQGDRVALTIRCEDETSNQVVDAVVSAIGRKPVLLEGTAAFETHPGRIRVVGDGTGRRARHVVAALGDGCIAAAELLAQPAGEMK